MLTRRRFLQASGAMIAAATAGLGFYTWRVEPHWLEFVYRSLPIRGLPSSLQGRTLVQLSDIHVGGRVDDEYVIAAFQTGRSSPAGYRRGDRRSDKLSSEKSSSRWSRSIVISQGVGWRRLRFSATTITALIGPTLRSRHGS